MTIKLVHEALAKRHNFSIRFALRIEIGATLTTADRQTSKAVFKDLLQAKEFDNRKIYGRVETKPALVRADCAVKLYAVPLIHVYTTVIIHPRNTEQNSTLRLSKAF